MRWSSGGTGGRFIWYVAWDERRKYIEPAGRMGFIDRMCASIGFRWSHGAAWVGDFIGTAQAWHLMIVVRHGWTPNAIRRSPPKPGRGRFQIAGQSKIGPAMRLISPLIGLQNGQGLWLAAERPPLCFARPWGALCELAQRGNSEPSIPCPAHQTLLRLHPI